MDNLTLRVQGGNYMRDHKGLKDIARNIRKDIVSMIHMSKSDIQEGHYQQLKY